MTTLQRPDFIERSPTVLEPQIIAAFEAALGKQLQPGQLERLLLNVLAYREFLVRIGIQYAAEQNLVNYAIDEKLDQLGALLNVARLGTTAASVTLQFSRDGVSDNFIVPAGTTARQPGSAILFATDEAVTIAAGQSSATAQATATTTGESGNGFAIGVINQLVNAPDGLASVTNTTASATGADSETDAAFRERIKLAPTQFSVAGARGAYKFYALSANSSITDVSVIGPEDRGGANPVTVDVYPLTSTGLPSAGVLTEVSDILNLETIRPLTDIVDVQAPTEINYSIEANIIIFDTADQAEVQTALDTASATYITERASKLGNNIVLSQIIDVLQSVEGVYSVELVLPVTTLVIGPDEWANGTGATITIVGTNGG